MFFRTVVAIILAVPLVAVGASSSASAQAGAGVVAMIEDSAITSETFDHWLTIAVKTEDSQAVVPEFGTKPWTHFRNQVMAFLISGEWIQGEAELQQITVSRAQVLRAFRRSRDQSFPTRRSYLAFLRRSGMTQDDVLFRVRLDLLSEKLYAGVTRGLKSRRARRRALDRFVRDFKTRWRAKTSCAESYRTSDCSQSLPAPG